jgi:hypothetical protein
MRDLCVRLVGIGKCAMTEIATRNVVELSLGLLGIFLFLVLFPYNIDFKSVVKSFSLFHSFLKHVSLKYSVVTTGNFHQ